MAFIISKRNFSVPCADGSKYLIRKDYVGSIPDEVLESTVVQMAIRGGLIAVSGQSADKALDEAKANADGVEADIRPDAKKGTEPEKVKPEESKKAKKKEE